MKLFSTIRIWIATVLRRLAATISADTRAAETLVTTKIPAFVHEAEQDLDTAEHSAADKVEDIIAEIRSRFDKLDAATDAIKAAVADAAHTVDSSSSSLVRMCDAWVKAHA